MDRSRRRAALSAACSSAARSCAYRCEPLERRVLLDGNDNDPVIVLVEQVQDYVVDEIHPGHLWTSEEETLFDPHSNGQPDGVDRDENGYPDDAYGWNFATQSPVFAYPNDDAGAGHGAIISLTVKNVIAGSRVKIMYVITNVSPTIFAPGELRYGTDALNYILAKKDAGVNIVAVGTIVARTDRAGAQALNDAGIMLIGGLSNAGINHDSNPGDTTNAFYNATPRRGVQAPALDNIIPVTTDHSVLNPQGQPIVTDYGINSFYGGVATQSGQSFSGPEAAAMATVAVQAYLDVAAHNGVNPSVQQIKGAMMSGATYTSVMNNKTITHDFVGGLRQGGGLFNLGSVMSAINATPQVTEVKVTRGSSDPLGTEIQFALSSIGTPTNWTISWGDNSFADKSGVRALPGGQTSEFHTFPFEILPHHYFPTIYAMLGTGAGRQVYLQSSQLDDLVVTTPFAPTTGQDNYFLSRDGDDTVLTLRDVNNDLVFTHSFAQNQLPTLLVPLGQGNDTLTVDFSNGNPLENTELTVTGTAGAGNRVRVVAAAGADTIGVEGTSVNVSTDDFTVDENVAVYVYASGGDDTLRVNMNGTGSAIVHVDTSELFIAIHLGAGGGIVVDQDGYLALQTQELNVASGAFIDLNDNEMIIDYKSPTSPIATIQSLLTSGYAGGAWTGNGIRTSLGDNSTYGLGYAENDFSTSGVSCVTFANEAVDDTAVLVRYTFYGDADINGNVNINDFTRLAGNFNLTGKRWAQGDFNFDTNVNVNDFSLLAANFGSEGLGDDPGGGEGLWGGGGGSNSFGGGGDDDEYYTYEELWDMLMHWND